MSQVIASGKNQWVKRIQGLSARKQREEQGLFVAEGLRFVSDIPKDWEVLLLALSESFAQKEGMAFFEKGYPVQLFTDAVFASLCDTKTPQGILAVCRQKTWQKEMAIKAGGFYLLAEELQDPGNLGTVIRTADAAGVDGIFLSKGSVDLYNPKVLRSTMGSLFHVPVFQNCNLKEEIEGLQQKGCIVLAAHLAGTTTPYDLDLRQGCGIVLGNEARGLTEELTALCDTLVKLPMPGRAESLNASVAAGVLLYEVVRQRLGGA